MQLNYPLPCCTLGQGSNDNRILHARAPHSVCVCLRLRQFCVKYDVVMTRMRSMFKQLSNLEEFLAFNNLVNYQKLLDAAGR
jgi:hypothetical protein